MPELSLVLTCLYRLALETDVTMLVASDRECPCLKKKAKQTLSTIHLFQSVLWSTRLWNLYLITVPFLNLKTTYLQWSTQPDEDDLKNFDIIYGENKIYLPTLSTTIILSHILMKASKLMTYQFIGLYCTTMSP